MEKDSSTKTNDEAGTRINVKLNSDQRLVAYKACHMLSKLPIRELRFEVLSYLTTADVERFLSKIWQII